MPKPIAQRKDSIHRGRKYDQVLAGARKVFMTEGFEGASVDDIARTAQVSKATLYKYFSDKQLLFIEVANIECQRQASAALDTIDRTAPPRKVLSDTGRHFLGFVTSKFGLQMFRVCVAETDRFPELGRRFYESGPAVLRRELAAYFEQACARNELAIEDYIMAADQFGELCKAGLWMELLFGVIKEATPAEIDRVVDNAVDTFLARYGR
ncbi:TetR/AcrR family transcriptional regulator [Sulfitobacter guttiformis]|uniref:TetR family transcriptional regulator n=1 Tax=Sulfitobacter guttiformis TaxID=74349 RepID=A0A420DSV4_9RHOB|nr:TetR/AcrR family transcriptional regulator [Sulfitobacter guttiformis]KIN74668.1 Transcriptional regulator, TetR family protein [Sulfitobacter guttiformis KCTC 32187]RKE97243.1 TetR family transcriptional regulator [Sulfitobacter guttiformis]